MMDGKIYLGWDSAADESGDALFSATTSTIDNVTLTVGNTSTLTAEDIERMARNIAAKFSAFERMPRTPARSIAHKWIPLSSFGTILRHPETGAIVMVVGADPVGQWVNALVLDADDLTPGNMMRISDVGIRNWVYEETAF